MYDKEEIKKVLKEKISFFSKRRNDLITLILIIVIYNQNDTNNTLIEKDINKDKFIERLSSFTTYITDNGTIKQYEKETFDAYNQKQNVAKILTDYLILSARTLTNNYKVTFFPDEKTFFKNSADLSTFYENFIEIDFSYSTEKQKIEFKKVQNDFKQILAYLQTAVTTNQQPHLMDKKISDINVKTWKTSKNEFEIFFTIPVFVSSNNKYNVRDEGLADITISAKGYFNIANKKTLNPLGMYFTELAIIYPKINHNKTK